MLTFVFLIKIGNHDVSGRQYCMYAFLSAFYLYLYRHRRHRCRFVSICARANRDNDRECVLTYFTSVSLLLPLSHLHFAYRNRNV